MKKTAWFMAGALILALAFGTWTWRADAQQGPSVDDGELMLGLDMGGTDFDPPGKGAATRGQSRRMPAPERMHSPADRRKMMVRKLKQEDPDRYERLEKIRALAKEYRETEDDKEKKKIEKELRPLVEKELKAQQEENKERIKRMEQKLEEMKKVLKKREQNWDQVVDHTVDEITGQNDYLRAWRGMPHRR